MGNNKRDLTIGIDGDPKGFDGAAKSAVESAAAIDKELGKLERQLEMTEQRTKATADAIKKYGREQDKAALEAKKLGDAAEKAGQRAERAQQAAADAAEKLADGEGDAARASELAAHAEEAVEHAALKAAEAHRAAGRAADQQADQERQLARDAALAAATERLGTLRAQGALVEHNNLLRQVQRRYPELEKSAAPAFQLMTSAATRFGGILGNVTSGMTELSGVGRAMPGLIIAGLELLPAVAAAAGGAITLGLGGAFTAIGIIAAAKNKEIRAEYSSLGKEIFGHLEQDAQPFVGVLEHVGMYAEDEFRTWGPLIRSEFADTAPYVDRFAHTAIDDLGELKPALSSIMKGFRVQLAGLGPELGPSIHNIATGVEAIGDAAAKNPQALGELVHDLSLIIRVGGDVIGFFTRWEGQINRVFEQANAFALGPLGTTILEMYKLKNLLGSSGADKAAEEFVTFGGAAQGAAGATTQTGMATQKLATAQQLATLSTKQFTAALTQLTAANMNEDQAAIAAAEAANAAAKATDHRRKVSLEERSALLGVAQADQQLLVKMKENGASADTVANKMASLRAGFIATARHMGYTADEAKKLADRYGLLPKSKDTKLTSNVAAQKKAVQEYQNKINSLHGKHIDIYQTMHLTTVQAYVNKRKNISGYARGGLVTDAGGGPAQRLAGGGPSGLVSGPGSGTSDSILTALSSREFVVNAEDAEKNLPLLKAINAGRTVAAGMTAPRAMSAGGARGGDGASITVVPPDVRVIVDGHELFSVVKEKGREYTTRNHGRSPFATAAGG